MAERAKRKRRECKYARGRPGRRSFFFFSRVSLFVSLSLSRESCGDFGPEQAALGSVDGIVRQRWRLLPLLVRGATAAPVCLLRRRMNE